LSEEDLSHHDIKKFWLHQANLNMNNFILKRIVGDDELNADKAPCVLDEFANTSSAGSLIAYHRHNDLQSGDKGIICSFGGGYSICSILVEK
jgi:3-oxoacyl-[acyl-carrier-protein] synthase III